VQACSQLVGRGILLRRLAPTVLAKARTHSLQNGAFIGATPCHILKKNAVSPRGNLVGLALSVSRQMLPTGLHPKPMGGINGSGRLLKLCGISGFLK